MNRQKLSDYREVLVAREKFVSVQLRLNDLDKAATNLNQQTINNKETTDRLVDSYLADEGYEHKDMQQELTSSIEKINSERNVARMALVKARTAVSLAEYEATRKICERFKPEFAQIPPRMSKALIAVQEIYDEEKDMRTSFTNDGIDSSPYIPSCTFLPAHGNDVENGHYSLVGHWHRLVIKNGYLKPSDVPKQWRKIWDLDSVQMDGQSKGNGEARPETTVKQNEDGWLNFN